MGGAARGAGGGGTYPVAPPGARDGGGGAAAAARAVAAPGALGGAHELLHARRAQSLKLPHLSHAPPQTQALELSFSFKLTYVEYALFFYLYI